LKFHPKKFSAPPRKLFSEEDGAPAKPGFFKRLFGR